jgi:hypothetical protein
VQVLVQWMLVIHFCMGHMIAHIHPVNLENGKTDKKNYDRS